MSFTFNDEIKYADSPNLDAFGRLRVSNNETILENFFPYDKEPLLVSELTAGTASSTWTTASTIHMSIGNSNGDRIVRQSKVYAKYQPGKSQLVLCTGILNDQGGVEGLRSRIGYFDDLNDKSVGIIRGNGLFFELNGNTLYVVKRKTVFTGGTPEHQEKRVPKSEWNLDRMDGSGDENNPSGLEIDISKGQIFLIDFEWLGLGRVRYGFVLKGLIYYVHEETHYNELTSTYINTPILPIRYEFENISGVTHTSNMYQVCGAVSSEADFSELGKILSVDNGVSTRTVSTTLTPILSVRLQERYNRSVAELISYSLINITSNRFIRFGVYLNAEITSPTWEEQTGGKLEYDVSAPSIDVSAATLIASGYISDKAFDTANIKNILNLSSDISGNRDIITIAAQSISSTADMLASLRLQEKI